MTRKTSDVFEKTDFNMVTCRTCDGKGKDPRNRKRKCPACHGAGRERFCTTCEEYMPCSGMNTRIMDYYDCKRPEER